MEQMTATGDVSSPVPGGEPFRPFCVAPFMVMDLDPAGNVQACCVNAMYPLGNVQQQSLSSIWHGERARVLREAVAVGDLTHGCGVCRHRMQLEAGRNPDLWYYQGFPVENLSPDPDWPFMMAFALHNTCNAACVMCGGDLSSKIRSQREHRPPLRSSYDEAFFADLDQFLPHLGAAEFRGGEPFLVREHWRIFDRLIEIDNCVPCHITTNGTILDAKVERVMDAFPLSFMISVDGSTRETLEAVRVGVSYDLLMRNIPKFKAYADNKGTRFELSACVLQQNWQEIPDLLRMAEDWDARLALQPVLDKRFGLHRLPVDELRPIVRELESRSDALLPALGEANTRVWLELLGWLNQEVAAHDGPEPIRIFEFPDAVNPVHVSIIRKRASGGDQAIAEPSEEPPRPAEVPWVPPSAVVAPAPRPRRWSDRLAERVAPLRRLTAPPTAPAAPTPTPEPTTAPSIAPAPDAAALREGLAAWSTSGTVGELVTDPDDRVVSADVGPLTELVGGPVEVVGLGFADALQALADLVGPNVWVADEFVEDDRVEQTLFFGRSEYREKLGVVVRLVSFCDPADQGRRIHTLFAVDSFFHELEILVESESAASGPPAGP